MPRFSLPASSRLLRPHEFSRCYRKGRRQRSAHFSLFVAQGLDAEAEGGTARLGITASRKVGKAVVRNRLRRWIREVFRQSPRRSELAGLDLVVHVQPGAGDRAFRHVEEELSGLFAQAVRSRGRRRRVRRERK